MTRRDLTAPPAVQWITRTLERAGFETWTVGGALRNLLLGLPSGDWDLTTRAHPNEVRGVFRRTVPIGVEHGTVGVLAADGTLYELTTFRRDVETDGRRAVVAFADRIEDDLARRDFTINAIAWHALRDELRDPFEGEIDLERRVLRAVGDPERRFAEDRLRVLRGIRFASRFALRVEDATWEALRGAAGALGTLSAERVREELLKVLGEDARPGTALELHARAGVLHTLYPEWAALRDADRDGWRRALAAADRLPRGRPFLRLAVLLRPLPAAERAAILLRSRLSRAQVDGTAHRAGAPRVPSADASDGEVRRWLSEVGRRHATAVARLDLAEARTGERRDCMALARSWAGVRRVRDAGPPLEVGELAIDGRDLIRMGLKPGPEFGALLQRLLDWVLEDPDRNRAELLRERALVEAEALEDGRGTGDERG